MKGKKQSGWRTADLCMSCLNFRVYILFTVQNFVVHPKLQDFHLILIHLFHWKQKRHSKKEGFD